MMRMRRALSFLLRGAACLAAALASGQAPAVSNTYAVAPAAKVAVAAPALRLSPGTSAAVVYLEADETLEGRIFALKQANAASGTKALQIGVGREVPQLRDAMSPGLAWRETFGGRAAQWMVTSRGARAMRIGLEAAFLPSGTEIRFAGDAGKGTVYGPFTAAEIFAMGPTYWSPVLEDDSAVVEVFVPDGSPGDIVMAIARISHLFASPSDADVETAAKAAQACEVDLICRSATDAALATVGKSVARMTFTLSTGGTALCTGTLLNPLRGALIPYFYSANHCISTQASASTLTTHWFYDRTGCGTGVTSASYVQLTGGATLLFADATSDVLFMRLNSTPPVGAVYAGWDSTTLGSGALTAVHHPAGDLKKVSLGTFGGFASYGGAPGSVGNHIFALWNSTATGVTEGGSSGSGIFTAVGSPASEYRLRGGLHGGASSCTATGLDLSDYYSRFDQAYPSISQYLDPPVACSYSLSPTSQSVSAVASSNSFGVTTSSGCAWAATSNASWITTTSSGTGTGTVMYSAAANVVASSRIGTLTVACQTFTVTQAAAIRHTLSVSVSGLGTVTSSPAGISCGIDCAFSFTAPVTLTAVASTGFVFAGWSSGGCSGPGPCTLAMTADTTVNAAFLPYTGTLMTRYRLYSPGTFEHLYTTDLNEFNVLPVCCAWVPEGSIYRLFNGAGSFGGVATVPYYRLYNPFSFQHHWTTDVGEYNFLPSVGWIQEGVDGQILRSPATGALPLYRLYLNAAGGLHLWTIDANERDYLVANAGWVDEGVAGYVIPLP